ncbi:MAG: PHP domain-containing protein [Gammaproteobacteria bacterium]|nr:PHP domain-containing protein [Gammaproteobacteria bacterium]
MKFDLHCHSHCSDGELSPADLVALAGECEITHLALTDHDTLSGLAEAAEAARKREIQLINGVELSCSWNGQLLHILGLGVDPENTGLLQGIKINMERRTVRALAMVGDFAEHGIELEEEVDTLLKGAVPTRPHFAQALVNLGYARDKRQAFKRFLVPGKPGYVPMQWPNLEQISEWITEAGGVAVLAHPLRYNLTRSKLLRLIGAMQNVGVLGMEVSTSTTDRQQTDMLADLAVQHDLLASVGSDFHSLDQPWARLGSAQPLPAHLVPVWSELTIS